MESSNVPVWLYSAIGVVALAGALAPVAPAPPVTVDVPPSATAPAQVPAVAFDVTTPLVFDRRNGASAAIGSFMLKNDGEAPRQVTLTVRLLDLHACQLAADVAPAVVTVPARDVKAVSVSIAHLRSASSEAACTTPVTARGYLLAATDGSQKAPALRSMRIDPSLPSNEEFWIVCVSLILAVCIVVAGVSPNGWHKLRGRMGPATWGNSWGSNTTLGAALLAALLGAALFPEQTHYMPRKGYVVLSVLFAAIVGLAPVVYATCRTPVRQDAAPAQTVQYEGYVFGFALAAVFTLWGAVGQLVTVLYAVAELQAALLLPTPLAVLIWTVTGVLLAVLMVYGTRSVRALIAASGSPPAAGLRAEPMPAWHLL